jgi:CTP synthase
VIQALDVKSIYQVPVTYHNEKLDVQVLKHFGLNEQAAQEPNLDDWRDIAMRFEAPKGEVTVALVGKYTGLSDAYKSLTEALDHAGIAHHVRVNVRWVNARVFEQQDEAAEQLQDVDAILVPGGFGERGVRGKIAAAKYARVHKVPYLGICFGMQMAVLEYAQNVLGIEEATSTEFGVVEMDDPRGSIVGLMTEWQRGAVLEKRAAEGDLGGTMRLGAYDCALQKDTLAHSIYGADIISERHRHRYEVNIAYREELEAAGLKISGTSPSGHLPEIIELPGHPWFFGVQFHPEFKSRPHGSHPLFKSYIEAAIAYAASQKSRKAADVVNIRKS